jgi:CRP-like cAMP-binding protein
MDTPRFPHHRDCQALTGITLDHLPRDGSLGRVRRFAKGAFLWRPDSAADRIYFLRKGRIVVSTAKPHERPVALRTIEPNQPFGELCLCSVLGGVRGTTACAVVASETFEIKLIQFLNYLGQNRPVIEAMMVSVSWSSWASPSFVRNPIDGLTVILFYLFLSICRRHHVGGGGK